MTNTGTGTDEPMAEVQTSAGEDQGERIPQAIEESMLNRSESSDLKGLVPPSCMVLANTSPTRGVAKDTRPSIWGWRKEI